MIKLPFGLCDVTFGDTKMTTLADSAIFEASPKYTKLYAGFNEPKYLLESYDVSLSLSLAEESFQNLTLAIPQLQPYANGGYYENASKIDTTGKTLIIHPRIHGDSKDFDIVILRAIVDPENPFVKTYGKSADSYMIRFIGLPSKQLASSSKYKSYFYIGDWENSGVLT